jgi:hypothetical protein
MSDMQPDDVNGPVARLLEFNQKIFRLEAEYRRTKSLMLAFRSTLIITLAMTLAIYCATDLTWRKVNLGPINRIAIPITLASLVFCIALAIYIYGGVDQKNNLRELYEIKLELDQEYEAKRLSAASLSLGPDFHQYVYKDSIPVKIITLRRESSAYRRVHNILQGVIIIGSLMTTTLAGMSGQLKNDRWYTVATSFFVGVSAGFAGYYKFREKGFYLQQTADQIEHELAAAELGIDKYTGKTGPEALAQLSAKVEELVNEQKKRQQQLDQAAEKRDS